MGSAVNFVAFLAVLAATSFALPLLVQGCEALGMQRSASVAVSLALALAAVAAWALRAWRRASPPRRTSRRGGAVTERPRAASAGVVDGAAVRLVDAEEESRAGV